MAGTGAGQQLTITRGRLSRPCQGGQARRSERRRGGKILRFRLHYLIVSGFRETGPGTRRLTALRSLANHLRQRQVRSGVSGVSSWRPPARPGRCSKHWRCRGSPVAFLLASAPARSTPAGPRRHPAAGEEAQVPSVPATSDAGVARLARDELGSPASQLRALQHRNGRASPRAPWQLTRGGTIARLGSELMHF